MSVNNQQFEGGEDESNSNKQAIKSLDKQFVDAYGDLRNDLDMRINPRNQGFHKSMQNDIQISRQRDTLRSRSPIIKPDRLQPAHVDAKDLRTFEVTTENT